MSCLLVAGCPTPLACDHAGHCVGGWNTSFRLDCGGHPLDGNGPSEPLDLSPYQQDPNVND